jgi:pilus assembly protein CpaB
MSRRRRAALLLGLALVLGGLAAADVSRREAALARKLGPAVGVVVAREPLAPGDRVVADRLSVRRVPARYAPAGALGSPGEAVGLRVIAAIPAGAYVTAGALGGGPGSGSTPGGGSSLRAGERVADLTAAGPADLITPGGRVDVLVTRDPARGGSGQTALALEDVEVLAASAAEPGEGSGAGAALARVRASLRVTVRQAGFLAAAQAFSREVRLLPRAPGDDRRGAAGLVVGADLAP